MTDEKEDVLFGEGERKMVRVGDIVQNYAQAWAKRVVENAERVGVTKQTLDEMKERMAKWHNIVQLYQKEMREVRHEKQIDDSTRARMLKGMKQNLDQTRCKIFGGPDG